MQEELRLRGLILSYIQLYEAHERAIQDKLDWMAGIDSDDSSWTREWELRVRTVERAQERLEGKRKEIALWALENRGYAELGEMTGERILEILKREI